MLFHALHGFCSTMPNFEGKKTQTKQLCKVLLLGAVLPFDSGHVPTVRYPCFVHCFAQRFKIIWPGFTISNQFSDTPWAANFHKFWGARSNVLPYPSSAGGSKHGGSISCTLCSSQPVMQYAGCIPCWTVQDTGYFVQQNASIFIDHGLQTCNQLFVALCYFSSCPYCRNCLIFQTENVSPTAKQLLSKEQITGLQIAVLWQFLFRIVREWRVPWCRTESRRWRGSGFLSFFPVSIGWLARNARKQTPLFLFLCVCVNLCKYIRLCYIWWCHLFFCDSRFAMNLKGVSSKTDIPLHTHWQFVLVYLQDKVQNLTLVYTCDVHQLQYKLAGNNYE